MASVPKWFSIVARVLFALLALLTSLYCLLAYIPDTFFSFIQAPILPWVTSFIRIHAYLYAGALALLSASFALEFRSGRTRRIAWEFIVFHAGVAVFLFLRRPFSHLENNSLSYLWSLAAIFPVIWIGILDRVTQQETRIRRRPPVPQRQIPLQVALFAGLGMAVLYPATSWLRYKVAGETSALGPDDLVAWSFAVLVQLLFAFFAVGMFNLAAAVADRAGRKSLRFVAYALPATVLVAMVYAKVLLSSIPFNGLEANVYAGFIALALVLFVSGVWGLARPYVDEFERSEQYPRSWRDTPAAQNAALLLVLAAASYTVPGLIGTMDWNSVLAKLLSTLLWIALFAVLARALRPKVPVRSPAWAMLLLCVASYAGYRLVERGPVLPHMLPERQTQLTAATARHAVLDAPFQVVRDFWSTSEQKPCDPLCQFLREQTNIPSFISVRATDVKLGPLQATDTPKPNIFIVTVDSLRRDYLSPYNPAVTFTPEIGAFGEESVVMKNSFTRYAGTSLSEPAIWAGGMLLHKHYVQPFHMVNSLEKLVEADGYDPFVSVDVILQRVLNVNSGIHKMDTNIADWASQDFCATEAELQQKLDQRTDTSRPIFMYTQPQNIHVVSLYRAGLIRPPQEHPGFYAPAATEIQRMDACFGNFIRYLKARGLYDNSIVVLTADHGESYGEAGHRNHAFGLYPEVLRIPLIIHLPKSMQGAYYHDPDALAFNVDITPSIYYLLGHRPVANDPKLGRPLFTLTKEENQAYQRDSYLVVVCYGPVYGILDGKGQNLFVANEMDSVYQYFDLVHDPFGANNLANTMSLDARQRLLRSDVQDIADFYHYRYHSPTFINWMVR